MRNKPTKMMIRMMMGKPHHHHIPRKMADELMALKMVIPRVGIRVGPSPSASRLAAAKIAEDTLLAKLAASQGSILGTISRNNLDRVNTRE